MGLNVGEAFLWPRSVCFYWGSLIVVDRGMQSSVRPNVLEVVLRYKQSCRMSPFKASTAGLR